MKKLILAALILVTITGCNSVTETLEDENAVEIGDRPLDEIPISDPENTDKYRIVMSTTSSMSDQYELVENDVFITDQLPEEVQEGLNWPLALELSPNDDAFLYMNEWDLSIYDIENKQINPLMTFLDTTEGVNCQWNTVGTKIACISVNQQNYDSLTKIFVLDLKNKILTNKKEFSETVQYVCGASCYPEFWWEGETTLAYPTHNMIEAVQTIVSKQV